MSQEQILLQLAELQRANARLEEEVTALKSERDRLVSVLQSWIPFPSSGELNELAQQPMEFTHLIDELSRDLGVVENG